MMKAPWLGFSFLARPHSRLMISWIAIARRTDSSVGVVIAFVVGVGVQRVAVVVDGDQRLQRGADVVEVHLLGVQRAAGGLDVVLQLLAALVGAVLVLHRHGPDAAGDAADHEYSGSMPLLKKNDRLGAKSSICMPRPGSSRRT